MCPVDIWCPNDVVLTSMRRNHVASTFKTNPTLFLGHVPVGWYLLLWIGKFSLRGVTCSLGRISPPCQSSKKGQKCFQIIGFHIHVRALYRIRGDFRGLPIFAVFRGQFKSAKIKIAKYFPISGNGL